MQKFKGKHLTSQKVPRDQVSPQWGDASKGLVSERASHLRRRRALWRM